MLAHLRKGTGGLPHSALGRPAADMSVLGCHQRCRIASARAVHPACSAYNFRFLIFGNP